MWLSSCCQLPPKTTKTEDNMGFCGKCGQWVEFINYGEEELDDFSKLENEFGQFRDKVSAVMDFYGNPSHYIVTVESDNSLVQMDQGQNARELLALIQRDEREEDKDEGDDVSS